MGIVIQLREASARPVQTATGANHGSTHQMAVASTNAQIVAALSACDALGRSVDVLQKGLRMLNNVVGSIEDPATGALLQHEIKLLDAMMVLELEKLTRLKTKFQTRTRDRILV